MLIYHFCSFLLFSVTESIFAAGYNTPPTNSPFMSISPLELVSKNFHSGTVAFSQVSSALIKGSIYTYYHIDQCSFRHHCPFRQYMYHIACIHPLCSWCMYLKKKNKNKNQYTVPHISNYFFEIIPTNVFTYYVNCKYHSTWNKPS